MSESNKENKSSFSPIEQSLFDSRTVFINGPVNSDMAIKVNSQLLALEKADSKKSITVWINSPGGEINSGFAVYDMIQFIEPKVVTVVSGMAASMGATIALAAEKENRFALTNARILIHQPLIGGVVRGQASDLEIHARDIIKMKKKMHELYSERTGTDIKTFEELMERDYWVNMEEAQKMGLISKVLSSRSELDKAIS